MNFQPDKLYLNILNSNEKPVQGSILNRTNTEQSKAWYLVVSTTPLVLFIPQLDKNLEIPSDRDPRLVIKAAIAQYQVTTNPRKAKKNNGKPSKKINYAQIVVERGY